MCPLTPHIRIGEMPERSKGAVLKTAERKFRGFESLSLRQGVYRRGDREAEGDRLLSDLAPKSATRVRIPPSPLLRCVIYMRR